MGAKNISLGDSNGEKEKGGLVNSGNRLVCETRTFVLFPESQGMGSTNHSGRITIKVENKLDVLPGHAGAPEGKFFDDF